MLPLVIVLLLAHSALATPVAIQPRAANTVPGRADNGAPINSAVVDNAFSMVDGGDQTVYALLAQNAIMDLADVPNAQANAYALAMTVGLLGELATGSASDACPYAEIVNAYANACATGSTGAYASAVANYVNRISNSIDIITNLAVNPGALRYSSGTSGACAGSGRVYDFENAWDGIISAASPANANLLNELYCTSRRLYNSPSQLSSTLSAVTTAAATAPALDLFTSALTPVSNFLRVAGSGGNPAAYGQQAKNAIAQAASRYY